MTSAFANGERVRVRLDWPEAGATQVHIRTPAYLRGQLGVVDRFLGVFANPEDLAFGRPGLPKRRLYRVIFRQAELWPGRPTSDTVAADIYEHWLEPLEPERTGRSPR